MKIHELPVTANAKATRLGRGIGSGKGKTSGRGTKGQNSRSGGGVRIGFEGGQNPLAKRLPKKRGFVPINRTIHAGVTLARLNELPAGTVVTNDFLAANNWVDATATPVKVLATGELKVALTIKVQAATKAAVAAIEAAGGSFEAIPVAKTPKKPSPRNRKAD